MMGLRPGPAVPGTLSTVWSADLCKSTYGHTLPHLLLKEESHAVAHLVPVDGGEGDVEEEAVQDGFGDPLQRDGQQQQRHADEDVGSQRRQASLLHLDDAEEDTHKWTLTGGNTIDPHNATDYTFSVVSLSAFEHIVKRVHSGFTSKEVHLFIFYSGQIRAKTSMRIPSSEAAF